MCDATPGRAIQRAIVQWYDTHARDLPWRVGPRARCGGERPDPYRVWLSEVMLQQTTVATVRGYFARFTARWPTIGALAAARDEDVMAEWAGLGYYARARNMLRCARVVTQDMDGRFPDTEAGLIALPGVGPYTAAAIAAIAFERPATVMDSNVERVMARLFAVTAPLPGAKPELKAHAARLTPAARPGDHAQAVMDLGATICTPRNPACGICPLAPHCRARALGVAHELPRKARRPAKPVRKGHVYVARRADGAWLVERRPGHGLLGGMLGFPGSDWSAHPSGQPSNHPAPAPPLEAAWIELEPELRHTFTHFHLRLTLHVASVGMDAEPERGYFMAAPDFAPKSMPTVMRKAHDLARPALDRQKGRAQMKMQEHGQGVDDGRE